MQYSLNCDILMLLPIIVIAVTDIDSIISNNAIDIIGLITIANSYHYCYLCYHRYCYHYH